VEEEATRATEEAEEEATRAMEEARATEEKKEAHPKAGRETAMALSVADSKKAALGPTKEEEECSSSSFMAGIKREEKKVFLSLSFLPLRARPLLLWILLTRKYLSPLGYSPLRENGRDPLPLPRDRSTRSQGAIFKAGLLFWVFFSFKVTKKKY